jgi:hypothetical protein
MDDNQVSKDSIFGLLLRIYWVAGGFVSFIAAASLATRSSVTDSSATILFWGNAVGMVGARFLDIKFFNGTTKDGAPATMSHWLKYSLGVVALSVFAWFLAGMLGGNPAD